MKKAVILILAAAVICGAGYFCVTQGYVDSWFPDLLPKIIPGYTPVSLAASESGRVSSSAENAVYVDKVEDIASLGSGNGTILRFAGKVEPQETKAFNADSDRTIDETFVAVGDNVKPGMKLFSYDTSEEEDKLEQDKIDLERLKNNVDTSEARQEKLEQELAQANTPEKQLELMTAKNEIKQNELDRKSKEKEIESLEQKIKNAYVSCDIEGVVKTVGESDQNNSYGYGSSNQSSAYITIVKVGTYRVKAEVNEQNISSIRSGMRMLVHSRMDSSLTWKGVVSEVQTDQGNDSDSNDYMYYGSSSGSTNYPFYVELDDSEGLMLGQHVYLEQDVGQENTREGMWLSDYYIVRDGNGEEDENAYVWAASKSNLLEKRPVILGEHDDGLKETRILSGLDKTDYITQPSTDLREGLPVNYNDNERSTESGYIYMETEDFDFSDEAYEMASEGFDFFSDEDGLDDFSWDDEYMSEGLDDITGLDFSDEDVSSALSSAANLFNSDSSFEDQSARMDVGDDENSAFGSMDDGGSAAARPFEPEGTGDVTFLNDPDAENEEGSAAVRSLDEGTGSVLGTDTGITSSYGSLGETDTGTVNVSDVAAGLSFDEASQS